MEKQYETFGERIKTLRSTQNLTHEAVAEVLGMAAPMDQEAVERICLTIRVMQQIG